MGLSCQVKCWEVAHENWISGSPRTEDAAATLGRGCSCRQQGEVVALSLPRARGLGACDPGLKIPQSRACVCLSIWGDELQAFTGSSLSPEHWDL